MTANPVTGVLDILDEAENARQEGLRRACELLLPAPTSTITNILVGKNSELSNTQFRTLLEKISLIVREQQVQRNITDWPFENFWGNPYEPRHSKLLKYFLNPQEDHQCGEFLLDAFVEVLKASGCLPSGHHFPVDHCSVSQPDYIDLLIKRDRDDGKYAIIVENKVNWAKDQWKQLQGYVKSVMRRDFTAEQIYVFYLPLTSAKSPDPDDINTIKNLLRVKYNPITFDKHILTWLKVVLDNESECNWPQNMHKGMSENLSHYRNLIQYLVNEQKEHIMNQEILKTLEKARKPLPTLLQVESLASSVGELTECLKSVLRRKLLLKIYHTLKEQEENVWLCLERTPTKKLKTIDLYDDDSWFICLGASANDAVSVGFGWGGSCFYLGYMKSNDDKTDQEKVTPTVLLEAKDHLQKTEEVDEECAAWWYSYCDYTQSVSETYDDSFVKHHSPLLAAKLVELRDSLVDRLKKNGIFS